MPGHRDRWVDRPAPRLDIHHHLVAGSGPKRAREQRRSAGQRLEALGRPNRRHARSGAVLVAEHRLFLDADGLLADFGRAAQQLPGMKPKAFIAKHSRGAFWKRLANAGNFYGSLPEMPDARILFDAVKHLKPTILTGLPLGNWAAPQKVEWAAAHFPGVPIITCMARDKHKHMHRGDVLVDDREKHRAAYEAAGVVFVHHRNADDSLRQLAKIFPSVRVPA